MKRTALIIALLVASVQLLPAQSRQETKWYRKTISAGPIEADDIFLKRYPKSVYREEIDSLRYDALCVTHIGNAEALSIISDLCPSLKPDVNRPEFFKAAALRDEGRDFIVGVSVREAGMPADSLRVYLTEKEHGIWRMPLVRSVAKPMNDTSCLFSVLLEDENIISFQDGKWLSFTYRNINGGGERMEHVEAVMPVGAYVFDNQEPAVIAKIFSGSLLSGSRIEGIMPEPIEGGRYPEWEMYLFDKLASNETLVRISNEDLLTDQAVTWWLKNNPQAQTTARSIKFGALSDSCSIVRYFLANREKEHYSGWSAALFDIRGYTVVCLKSPSGKYSLAWCEPRFKDRSSDRILNSVYFDKTNLVLFYYQGRNAFSYRINLASKTISR